MESRYLGYVEDMIESIDKILKFIDTTQGLADFLNNDMVIDAITRNFEIIGDAAFKVPLQSKINI